MARRRKRHYYRVEVEREITFRHTVRVLARDEEQAKDLAIKHVREREDWFGGDVTNDWITSSRVRE